MDKLFSNGVQSCDKYYFLLVPKVRLQSCRSYSCTIITGYSTTAGSNSLFFFFFLAMMTDTLIMSIIGCEMETITDNEMKEAEVVHQIYFTSVWIK